LSRTNGWQEFCNDIYKLLEQNNKEGEEMAATRYATVADLPEWAQKTVQSLMDKGFISDTDDLNLSEDMVRILVINDRAGLYK
jgi:hypothetical protein